MANAVYQWFRDQLRHEISRDGPRPDEPIPRSAETVNQLTALDIAHLDRARDLLVEEQRRYVQEELRRYLQARSENQARACGGGPGSNLEIREEDYGNIRRYQLREADGSERCVIYRRSDYDPEHWRPHAHFIRWADESARLAFRAMPTNPRVFTFGSYHIEAITVPDNVSADELRAAAREAFEHARRMQPGTERTWMWNVALPGPLAQPSLVEETNCEETVRIVTFRVTRTEPWRAFRDPFDVRVRDQAEERAKALLLENLDDEQQQDLLMHGHFKVKSTLTQGAYYRIYTGASGNIHFYGSDDKFLKHLCATSIDFGIPVCDVMLVQKIMIECDEAGFLAVANDLTARVEGPYVRFGTPRGIQGHGGGGALGSGMFAALRLVIVLVAVVALVATL